MSGGTTPRIHSPQHPLAAVVLDDLVLDVDLVAVPLSDGQHGVLATQHLTVLDPVVTRHISGVDAGVVGRLDSAGTGVAALKHSVTVRPRNQITSPRRDATVAITETRLAASQELVR